MLLCIVDQNKHTQGHLCFVEISRCHSLMTLNLLECDRSRLKLANKLTSNFLCQPGFDRDNYIE